MKKIIYTKDAPGGIASFSQAILKGTTLHISGQVAIDVKTGNMVQDDIEIETKQVMKNLKAILAAAGMNFEHVTWSSVFIIDMDDFYKVDKVYGSYFKDKMYPARATVQVAGLPLKANVEITMIASL